MSLQLRTNRHDQDIDELFDLSRFVPPEVYPLKDPQTDLPRIAKDKRLVKLIEDAARKIPTTHTLNLGDARDMKALEPESVHLVITSPPYWTLKEYRQSKGQMGHIENYEAFLIELDKVWAHCLRGLVPGGRLVCIVGNVAYHAGRTTVATLLSHFTLRSRNTVESSASTISHRLFGTKLPSCLLREIHRTSRLVSS